MRRSLLPLYVVQYKAVRYGNSKDFAAAQKILGLDPMINRVFHKLYGNANCGIFVFTL